MMRYQPTHCHRVLLSVFVHTRTVSEVDIRPHHSVSTTPCVVCAWPIVWLFVRLLTVAFCLHVCVVYVCVCVCFGCISTALRWATSRCC